MRRVVRLGGSAIAAVWDNYGGQLFTRILWDMAGVLDPMLERPYFHPLNGPDELVKAWRSAGMQVIEQTSLVIRMKVRSFDDYGAPFAMGEGPHGQYAAGRRKEGARETRKH